VSFAGIFQELKMRITAWMMLSLCLLSGNLLAVEAGIAAAENKATASKTEVPNSAATDTMAQAKQLQQYFFAAARSGEVEVLQYFVAAGYPVNEANPQSYTALMVAAYSGQAEAVQLLLDAGADACVRDKRGHTALMGAMIKAEWAIARTLHAVDCDADNPAQASDVVVDKTQMTAAQFAQIFGQSDKFNALLRPTEFATKTQTGTATAAPDEPNQPR
jgi:ankyrin repeat protein